MSDHLTLESLAERLQRVESDNRRLERQNRRLRAWAVTVLAALTAALCLGRAAKPKTVEAQRFVLCDEQGNMRAELANVPDDGSKLTLFDGKGRERIRLGMQPPALLLWGEGGMRARLSATDAPDLTLWGSQKASATVWAASHAALTLSDQQAGNTVDLSTRHGFSTLALEAAGEEGFAGRVQLLAHKNGTSYLTFQDKAGVSRARLGLSEEGPAAKLMDAEAEAVLWSAP